MKLKKVQKLEPGLYIIKWKKGFSQGKYSLASVGTTTREEGEENRWFHCCHWDETSSVIEGEDLDLWQAVKAVFPIILDSEFDYENWGKK